MGGGSPTPAYLKRTYLQSTPVHSIPVGATKRRVDVLEYIVFSKKPIPRVIIPAIKSKRVEFSKKPYLAQDTTNPSNIATQRQKIIFKSTLQSSHVISILFNSD